MNAERRKLISRASALITQAQDLLQQAQEEEEECLENMPDAFKDAEKGTAAQDAIDALEEAVGKLGDIDLEAALA